MPVNSKTPNNSVLYFTCVDLACFYLRTQSIKKAKHKTYAYSDFPILNQLVLFSFQCFYSFANKCMQSVGAFVQISVQVVQSPHLQDDTKLYELLCLCTVENCLCVGETIEKTIIITSIDLFSTSTVLNACFTFITLFCLHSILIKY